MTTSIQARLLSDDRESTLMTLADALFPNPEEGKLGGQAQQETPALSNLVHAVQLRLMAADIDLTVQREREAAAATAEIDWSAVAW